MPETEYIKYTPEATPKLFHASQHFVRGIMGPIGSGKSSACCVEIYMRALRQKPFRGVRRSRWAIIRNTYPELLSTTIKTWTEWVPEQDGCGRKICPITRGSPITGRMKIPDIGDGTALDMEVIFLACDRDEDVRKLKSLELTGGWINEACEIPKSVFDMLTGRVDRYPSKKLGGTTWTGVIMDTNPPDTDSWWYEIAEEKRPREMIFFKQPPGLILMNPEHDDETEPIYVPNAGQVPGIPAAENIVNHNSGFDYYMRQIPGKDREWIKVFIQGEYGVIQAGKPIYPEYNDGKHALENPPTPLYGLPLILGWDFGLNPACVVCQLTSTGQFVVLHELISEDMGVRRFVRNMVVPFMRNRYPGMHLMSVGDPAGSQRVETDEMTAMRIVKEEGLPIIPASTNKFKKRRDAVASFLMVSDLDGRPGFALSPECRMLRGGFMGKYCLRKMNVPGATRYAMVPDKNIFSHAHDALQYAALAARGGHESENTIGTGYGGQHAFDVEPDADVVDAWF